MTSSKQPAKIRMNWDPPSIFALAMAVALGTSVRLFFALSSDFPLNDGGLFYTMLQDLQRSHYVLPMYASYNSAGIPFAYPLLPLYLVAFLSDLMRWPLLDLVRLFPPIVSILTIPIFYLLSRTILQSKAQCAFAVFAFAMLPWSFIQPIKGGGLTRSPGFLFSLLALHQAYLLYTRRQKRFALSTALFAGLTILSHPEMAWFVAYSLGILFLFYGRDRQGIYNSLVVGAAVLALTAPWWATIVGRHGLSPFVSVSQAGLTPWYYWMTSLLTFDFTGEPFLGLLAVLGLLGVFVSIADKKLLLPIWLAAIFILGRRGDVAHATVPLAMLIGIGIDKVVLPAINRLGTVNGVQVSGGQPVQEHNEVSLERQLEGVLPKAVLGFFLVHVLVSAWVVQVTIDVLPREQREAMRWVAANTAETSEFLLITSAPWFNDAASEWFPALGQRVSLATVQGYEWLPNFHQRWERYEELQECASEDVGCLEDWAKEVGTTFTHVYIPKPQVKVGLAKPRDCCSSLRTSLQISSDYVLIYDGPGATILVRR